MKNIVLFLLFTCSVSFAQKQKIILKESNWILLNYWGFPNKPERVSVHECAKSDASHRDDWPDLTGMVGTLVPCCAAES